MDSNLKGFSSSKFTFDTSATVIGKGAFGTAVYEGKLLYNTAAGESKIAVKEVPKNGFVITGQKAIEDHILTSGNENQHPNVVQYFAFEKSHDFW